MRRPWSRNPPDTDYDRRRRDPLGGEPTLGAHGYDGADTNDSDLAPSGGYWGNREVREVDAPQPRRSWSESEDDADPSRRREYDAERSDSGTREAPHYYAPRNRGMAGAPNAHSGYGYGEQHRGDDTGLRGAERWNRGGDLGDDDASRAEGSFGSQRFPRLGRPGRWQPDRGPKGYTRSDERIRDDICECLYHEPDIDVREVSVTVSGGKVTLEGSVPERRMKHRVEDLCDERVGVRDIDNRIRVERVADAVHDAQRQVQGRDGNEDRDTRPH